MCVIDHNDAYLHVGFPSPRWVLSSAVLNGGRVAADHILNLRVEKNHDGRGGPFEPSEATLAKYCRRMGWEGCAVGMMTAAAMDSFRRVRREEGGVSVTALVTAGVSNAGRAGEPAECREFPTPAPPAGTINIILLTNARMAPAAMVEAVQMVTEAKTAALQDLDVRNPRTGAPATGTGTDAVAVAAGEGPLEVVFCGKHMLFGEMIASTVMTALTASLGGGRPRPPGGGFERGPCGK